MPKIAMQALEDTRADVRDQDSASYELSVVLPCLNEAATVGTCVTKALRTFDELRIRGEIVVVDNGSSDGSRDIASDCGARVVDEPNPGYGNALTTGIEACRAPYILMADSDDSYDLTDLGRFVEELRRGADLVMGTRLRGRIESGAMPKLNRWVGNPFFSLLLNLLFRAGISDVYCGMRAFTKDAYRRMQLQTTGMDFACEMVIKAALARMRIVEIPISLYRDGRNRRPHLRPFRDGWRTLRLMLLFSPWSLFLLPGALCIVLGVLPVVFLSSGPRVLFGLNFDVHYMALGSLLIVLGYQIVSTGLFAKVYSHAARLYTHDRTINWLLRFFTLERGLVLGTILFVWGFFIDAMVLIGWLASGRGALDALRPAIQASTLMIVGAQTIFSSFFLSMLLVPRRNPAATAR
ncbi:MAG: glycosyltransferase [Deltaproteobacteria bacterium]|nr:glycosyltransferase [Deltaproteobacteria bacterium]